MSYIINGLVVRNLSLNSSKSWLWVAPITLHNININVYIGILSHGKRLSDCPSQVTKRMILVLQLYN